MMSTANHLPLEIRLTLWRKYIRRFLHLRVSQPEPMQVPKWIYIETKRPLRNLLLSYVISGRDSEIVNGTQSNCNLIELNPRKSNTVG